MSLKRMSAVWDESQASGSTLLLLLAIADNANDDGLAWPGIETLVKRSRLGKRAVIKQLKRIEDMGELRIYRRAGQHNYYIVDVGLSDEQRESAIETLSKKTGESVKKLTGELCAPVITSSPTGELQFTSTPGSGEPQGTTTGEPQFTRSIIGTVNKDQTIKEPNPAAQAPPPVEAEKAPAPPVGESAPAVQPHIALIDAYWAGLPGGKPTADTYPRHVALASEIVKAGRLTPEHIAHFMRVVYGDLPDSAEYKYWRAKVIPFEEVEKLAGVYFATHPLPRPIHVDYGDETLASMWARRREEHFRALESGAYDQYLTDEERAAQAAQTPGGKAA